MDKIGCFACNEKISESDKGRILIFAPTKKPDR